MFDKTNSATHPDIKGDARPARDPVGGGFVHHQIRLAVNSDTGAFDRTRPR